MKIKGAPIYIHKNGFTIFESLIYLSLCVLMSWYASWWGFNFFLSIQRSMRKSESLLAAAVIMAHVVRDMETVPDEVAWYYIDHRLYRKYAGVQSVVADSVEEFVIIKHAHAVTCRMVIGGTKLSRYIRVGRGRFVCNCL